MPVPKEKFSDYFEKRKRVLRYVCDFLRDVL